MPVLSISFDKVCPARETVDYWARIAKKELGDGGLGGDLGGD